jgi:hypothetical protein
MTGTDTITARFEIHDRLLAYTRGIDRLDEDSLLSAFHPGAVMCDYGPSPMTIEDFASHALPSLRKRFIATQHRVSNIRIEIDDVTALVESYVLAYHVEETDSGNKLHTFNGRYIDEYSLRDNEWKMHQRTLRKDWSKTEDISEEMAGTWPASGRDRSDPIYTAGSGNQ